tara:strand:- start:139 stop:366 length:228 start_codon:yes stop_codon:yes gene_type:complete
MTDSFSCNLISQLTNRRHELGLPQTIVDHKIGVATGLVAKWETGNRKPTAFNLHCWAESLGCKITLEVVEDDLRY